ncbi:MAG: Ldh family oxidoreductase [Chloroflexi bacterium]|nr:Ldh family oxidoreductase [Chloroflexota bacterium]
MPHIPISQLTAFGARIFEAAGAPPEIARQVSASLVKADTYGVYSHGIGLLASYVVSIQRGVIQPAAQPVSVKESAVTALLDGQRGFGQTTAIRAIRVAGEKAHANGFGIVCAVNTNHVGRIGEYTEMAAEAGLIGIVVVNASRIVAPHGGLARQLGTNPIAFSVPVPGGRPLLVDFATSVVAANKLRVARNKGAKIPYGWVLDSEGAPSDDPNAFFNGGTLLTFGGHKGYGLSVMIEILAGLLSGSGSAIFDEFRGGNGVFMLALAPHFFRPSEAFLADVRRLIDALRATPPRDGVESVLVPGDPEAPAEARQMRDGIDVDAVTWQTVIDAGRTVGVEYAASY